MRNILLTNVYNFYNMGEMMQLRALREGFPSDSITLASPYAFVDPTICDELDIKVVGSLEPPSKPRLAVKALADVFTSFSWKTTGIPRLNTLLKAYRDSDVILDLGGDTFTDYPSIAYTAAHVMSLLPAILLSKPYVVCSQSIGPFKTPITRALARFILNKASLVTARDPTTYNYLTDDLHVESEVVLLPDLSLMKAVGHTSPVPNLLGLCVSQIIPKYVGWDYDNYVEFLKNLVIGLRERFEVMLIPHVYGPKHGLGKVSSPDDRKVIKRLTKVLPVMVGEHTDIPRCSFVLGFRMHACLNAVNHGIPSLYVYYSHKAACLPKLKWVSTLDARNMDTSTLLPKILQEAFRMSKLGPQPPNVLKEDASKHVELISRVATESPNTLLGAHIECRVGATRDVELLKLAASGGIATSLLLETLNKGTPVSLDSSLHPRPLNTKREVLNSTGSYYCTSSSLKEVSNVISKLRRATVVGLPCQIRELKRLYPQHLYVGLFCSHRVEFEGVSKLLKYCHSPNGHVVYRAKANSNTGLLVGDTFIPLKYYWNRFLNLCYIPKQCLKCEDLTAEHADISLGDAWGFPGVYEGLNVIIVRSEKGKELLQSAERSKLVVTSPTSSQSVISSQESFLKLKKGQTTPKLELFRIARRLGNFIAHHRVLHPILSLWMYTVIRTEKTKL